MKGKRKGIAKALAKMTVVPILLLGIIIGIFGIFWITSSMEKEIETELAALSNAVYSSFDTLCVGDFSISEEGSDLIVSKGETVLNYDYAYLDSMKEKTGADYTLFVGELRVLTTLTTEDGTRLTGTSANLKTANNVLMNENHIFYSKIDILGERYCAYYMPIYNSDGTCAGMFATVIPRSRVITRALQTEAPLLALIVIAAVFAIFWSTKCSNDFRNIISKLNNTFKKVSTGTLSNTVEPELLSRDDEFGDMAHSIVDMQASLRTLVNEDMLTKLANRRSGQERLEKLYTKRYQTDNPFCIALGDIDFFKKFNDTYGHDCGDLVLKQLASVMQKHIKDYGICSRWGGEEFLIIFPKGNLEECRQLMEGLLDKIRNHSISYQEMALHVTMTFGLIDSTGTSDWDDMVKKVDNLLYQGKKSGRNRLVVSIDN